MPDKHGVYMHGTSCRSAHAVLYCTVHRYIRYKHLPRLSVALIPLGCDGQHHARIVGRVFESLDLHLSHQAPQDPQGPGWTSRTYRIHPVVLAVLPGVDSWSRSSPSPAGPTIEGEASTTQNRQNRQNRQIGHRAKGKKQIESGPAPILHQVTPNDASVRSSGRGKML